MEKLKLEGVKIEFPVQLRINEADIVEWLEFKIGMSSSMHMANPLSDYELSDCSITIDKCLLNDREIKMQYSSQRTGLAAGRAFEKQKLNNR